MCVVFKYSVIIKDNSYAFIIDCSIDKETWDIIVYEVQPLIKV
ncbi:hypothetical protein [Wolbachia endosymbiont of Pentidionis agamae]